MTMFPARSHPPVPSFRAPLVVKVGGSLQPQVPLLVPILRASPRPLLIVPGGGQFADIVREAALDNEAAHWKAIEAMDTFGQIIASNGLPVTVDLAVPRETTVLIPSSCIRRHDPLPHSWDITSDTIAAWVASELKLDLLLLKSVDGILSGDVLLEHIHMLIETDVVDPCLLPFVLEHGIATFITSGLHPDGVEQYLNGRVARGTWISTTF